MESVRESRSGVPLLLGLFPMLMSTLSKMSWFLQRVVIVWLVLTLIIIAAVLHSIHQSGGFN